MATLVLGALGTLIGGPVGGAIGALAGRQIDGAVIGRSSREGLRLSELAVTTSSYGKPIAKHFGRMRAAGSIIWATDLQEQSDSTGGGKGKSKTTQFSYSISFAVALSSRPIRTVGRIWADGNLLRGSAGDLKTGGAVRLYSGRGNQAVDSLIAAATGGACPAFRNLAYIVFEDLHLEDFGNRIPALTFEVFADDGEPALQSMLEPLELGLDSDVSLSGLTGFSLEEGTSADVLATLAVLYPLSIDASSDIVRIGNATSIPASTDSAVHELTNPARAWENGDFGSATGTSLSRSTTAGRPPTALRYYDPSRDYQPSIQRAQGRSSGAGETQLEFPAALSSDTAKRLINLANARSNWAEERLQWRTTSLDTALTPGSKVRVPGHSCVWVIEEWEWRERGVEFTLRKLPPFKKAPSFEGTQVSSDGGGILPPVDLPAPPTLLRVFELPWDGFGAVSARQIYAALGSATAGWKGAALFAADPAGLTPIGSSGRNTACMGTLTSNLEASSAMVFDRNAVAEIELLSVGAGLSSRSIDALANGQNRLLIGGEIVQFANAEQLGPKSWKLTGLLRGRGGTEAEAMMGHPAGIDVTGLDDALIRIDTEKIPQSETPRLAALGLGDDEAVLCSISGDGRTLLPLTPVHPRSEYLADGGMRLFWTRRARGNWSWTNAAQTPLNEESELYQIGIGDPVSPSLIWQSNVPEAILSPTQLAEYSGRIVWAQQVGRFGQSPPLLLIRLP